MGKIRRGNFVFVFWEGDHPPQHVHVYRAGKLVVKWDLVSDRAMRGAATRQIIRHINELRDEGRL